VVEPGLYLDAFPPGFSLLNVYPAQIFYHLLVLVYTAENEKILTEHTYCMIFPSFGKVA
jgi:hypothetical protein